MVLRYPVSQPLGFMRVGNPRSVGACEGKGTLLTANPMRKPGTLLTTCSPPSGAYDIKINLLTGIQSLLVPLTPNPLSPAVGVSPLSG
jgi:hypothetical protein